jgi:hypothetical protein
VCAGRRDGAFRIFDRRQRRRHIGEVGVYLGNREPTLHEILDDPVARLLMASDGLQVEEVLADVDAARRRLAGLGQVGCRQRQGGMAGSK